MKTTKVKSLEKLHTIILIFAVSNVFLTTVTGAQTKEEREHVEDNSLDRFLKLILSFGFKIDSKGSEDKSLAYMAAERGQLDILKVLTQNGADLNQVGDFYQLTPLIVATKKGMCDIVEYLVSQKVDINAMDDENKSALYRAAEQDEIDCFHVLLKNGADPLVRGPNKRTILHEAAYNGDEDTIKELKEYKSLIEAKDTQDRTPLYDAAYKNHFESVQLLVDMGAKISTNVMWGAVGGGDSSIVEYLISQGGDVNSRGGAFNDTILMEAVIADDDEITELLLEKGADIEATNDKGFTAMHSAAAWDRKSTAQVLLKWNANINVKNGEGKMPLELSGPETKQILLQSQQPKQIN